MAPIPRVVVLGGAVPERLRAALEGNIEVVADSGEREYSAIVVHARRESLTAVRQFRQSGGAVPIYGLSEVEAPIADRLEWIREGADDLLTVEPAAAALIRRLRGGEPKPAQAVSAVPLAMRLDRWLLALDQYLALRRDLTRRLGGDGAARFLECVVHRDRVMRASNPELPVDPRGQRRSSYRDEAAWPLRVPEDPDLACGLINISADGLCFWMVAEQEPEEAFAVEVEGLTVAALLQVEVRWTRRMGEDRWEVGTYALSATITRSP